MKYCLGPDTQYPIVKGFCSNELTKLCKNMAELFYFNDENDSVADSEIYIINKSQPHYITIYSPRITKHTRVISASQLMKLLDSQVFLCCCQ